MKFELDTNAKTVKLLEDATLGDISTVMKKVLGDEANKYRILTTVTYCNSTIVTQPIVIKPTPFWWQSPLWQEYQPNKFEITCSAADDSMAIMGLRN